jgi:hypothetical protein
VSPTDTDVMGPVDPKSELFLSWKRFQETEEFANSKHWALVIAPFVQSGSAEKRRFYETMPFEQRERHIMGSLWTMYMRGFEAGRGSVNRS